MIPVTVNAKKLCIVTFAKASDLPSGAFVFYRYIVQNMKPYDK
jgi:hypothetical protein